MQEQANAIEDLFSKATDYLETRVELLELKAIGKTAVISSSFVSGLVVGIVLSLVLIFIHLGIAIWLGAILGQLYYGFFTVAAFYVLVGILLFLFRKQWLQTPVRNAIIKNLIK
jgi:phosphoglycerol transferase MdoB-like AlkP superfamily enzyme